MNGLALNSSRSGVVIGIVASILVVALLLLEGAGTSGTNHATLPQAVPSRHGPGVRPLAGIDSARGAHDPADSLSAIGTICLTSGALLEPGQQCPYRHANPTQIVWDAANGYLYAAAQNGSVYVISPVTNTVVATPSGVEFANGVAVDPRNGDVYVAGPAVVSVISGTTNTVVTGVGLGNAAPGGITFDPANGDLYVPVYGAGRVDLIDGATNTLVSNVSVGGAPWGAVYDSWNGDMYVTGSSGGIVVVNGTNNTVVARISGVGGSNGGAFDPSNGLVYIPDDNQDSLDVINGSTNTVVAEIGIHTGSIVQYDPVLADYDPDTGDICVPDFFQNDVAVVAGPSNTLMLGIPTGTESWGVAFDPATADGYVTNFGNDTVSIISPPDTIPITFSQTGLPVGANWTVSTSGDVGSAWNPYFLQTTSSSTRQTLFEPNGTLFYRVTSPGYSAAPSNGSIQVVGSPAAVTVRFTENVAPSSGASPLGWYVAGGLVLVLASVAVAWVVLRRRRSGPYR